MTDLSRDYMNSAFIPDGDSFYLRWQGQAAAFRDLLNRLLAAVGAPGVEKSISFKDRHFA